ncbi:ABC transporter ATP-binding protein, partial [Salmonella enterica subsp. enterica serovar Typhi]|nr:ABC transporter ATP-binding protein [Salmonella enterica subsp. enterica serovar Typhi]
MTTGQRLFRYAWSFKGIILTALLMLTIAVIADLAGPFVAKKVIDDHITGIESLWYQTEPTSDAVAYNGNFYKKAEYLDLDEEMLAEARILQVGRQFLFVDGTISFDG